MKKLFILLFAIVVLFTLVSCSNAQATCSHNWNAATCTAPKTCANCCATEGHALGHKEVVSPAKQATFSATGLTEGTYCSVCNEVIKPQETIAALDSNMVVGTDYYNKTDETTYRCSYSFTLYDNERFNLTILKVGPDESYELTGEDGRFNYLDDGIYELLFDNGRDKMKGTLVDGQLRLCNEDVSKWENEETRPQGNATIPLFPRAGNSIYGYTDLANNNHGASMQELYYRLFVVCEAFMDNNETIKPIDGEYIVDRINLDYNVLTADEAIAVWKVFYTENPRYYWLSNTVSLTGNVLNICVDPAYAANSYRKSCDKAIDNLAIACSDNLTSDSQLEKAMAIHDFILGKMNYAYKEDGVTPETAIWAHNLIGCAEKKFGVCESYAKAYQYLCRLNGMECIVVTDFDQQRHAWNVIKIDEKWYGVDCAFDETGKSDVSYNCFGMSAGRMQEEYDADGPTKAGINYLYSLPTLAPQGIELVNLYKNNTHVGLYANIDAAFVAMTDAKGNYEVRLFHYDSKGALLLNSAAVKHHITSAQTPKVQSLTLTGEHIALGNGYYTNTLLMIDKNLSIQSDVNLYNLGLQGDGSLDLKNKKLSFLGESAKVYIPITGNLDPASPSELQIGVAKTIEFWGQFQVHTLSESENGNEKITFRNNATIIKAMVHNISVYHTYEGGTHVHIKEFCPLSSVYYTNDIDIHGPAKLTVEKINSPAEYVRITLEFGKLNEFGTAFIGSANTEVYLTLNGRISYISTDVNGNEVNRWEESVNPKDLTVPIATLLDKTVMDKMKIYFINWIGSTGHHEEHTDEYMLNSKNQVVLKNN